MNKLTLDKNMRYGVVQQNPRITRDNIVSLRAVSAKEQPLRKVWAAIVGELAAIWNSMLSVKPTKTNSMCKYYGHVIRGPWAGHLPRCADCGCAINNPSELRKAVPVQ